MKVYDCEQGSQEWIDLRLGIPTASCFDKIVTPETLKPSASIDGYASDLVAEMLTGEPLDGGSSGFMKRGTRMEPQAVPWYEFEYDVDTTKVGFITLDDGSVGCSPDRLVGVDGGLEIKCPSAGQHVKNIFGMTTKYRLQVQGCMYVTGRQWWDLLSYNPCIVPIVVRIHRDHECIDAIRKGIEVLLESVRSKYQYITKECM